MRMGAKQQRKKKKPGRSVECCLGWVPPHRQLGHREWAAALDAIAFKRRKKKEKKRKRKRKRTVKTSSF